MAITQEELQSRAQAWISYYSASKGSTELIENAWATDLYDLTYNDPEALWALILEIHHRDNSVPIQQVLSAGPIEDLLAQHGADFIECVEAEARNDPSFAKLLGGVWQNQMPDHVWARLQAVWDRRGWDDIPE